MTALLVALKIDALTAEQVVAVVAAIGTLMVYIWGESEVDAGRAAALGSSDSQSVSTVAPVASIGTASGAGATGGETDE